MKEAKRFLAWLLIYMAVYAGLSLGTRALPDFWEKAAELVASRALYLVAGITLANWLLRDWPKSAERSEAP